MVISFICGDFNKANSQKQKAVVSKDSEQRRTGEVLAEGHKVPTVACFMQDRYSLEI